MVNGSTKLYFILGDPIAQVKSPEAFNRVFDQCGVNAVMLPLNVTTAGFDTFFAGLAEACNVDGVVLTVPHKFAGYTQCDTASDRAHFLQAANVMQRTADGRWHGDMVDGLGYVDALRKTDCRLEGRSVLLIGAGGAGCAIAEALVQAGIGKLAVHDENGPRRNTLVALLSGLGKAQIVAGSRDPSGFDIVINATPMGMKKDDPLPVMAERLTPAMFVGDVITVPVVSPLLEASRAIGCNTMTGSAMYDGVLALMVDFFGIEKQR